jgi:hypothetical protein
MGFSLSGGVHEDRDGPSGYGFCVSVSQERLASPGPNSLNCRIPHRESTPCIMLTPVESASDGRSTFRRNRRFVGKARFNALLARVAIQNPKIRYSAHIRAIAVHRTLFLKANPQQHLHISTSPDRQTLRGRGPRSTSIARTTPHAACHRCPSADVFVSAPRWSH